MQEREPVSQIPGSIPCYEPGVRLIGSLCEPGVRLSVHVNRASDYRFIRLPVHYVVVNLKKYNLLLR